MIKFERDLDTWLDVRKSLDQVWPGAGRESKSSDSLGSMTSRESRAKSESEHRTERLARAKEGYTQHGDQGPFSCNFCASLQSIIFKIWSADLKSNIKWGPG